MPVPLDKQAGICQDVGALSNEKSDTCEDIAVLFELDADEGCLHIKFKGQVLTVPTERLRLLLD